MKAVHGINFLTPSAHVTWAGRSGTHPSISGLNPNLLHNLPCSLSLGDSAEGEEKTGLLSLITLQSTLCVFICIKSTSILMFVTVQLNRNTF